MVTESYLQLTKSFSCFSFCPTLLLAKQVYIPASIFSVLQKMRKAVFRPKVRSCPLWAHLTSGAGFPVAAQVMLTGLPSL